MKQFDITGMSCAACSARIEKAVKAVDGVHSCSVNLLTNSMAVDGTASDAAVIDAVTSAGYGASVKGAKKEADKDSLKDKETPEMKKRLICSLFFLIVLMYFSMGHMWGSPMPHFFAQNHVAMGILQMLLAIAVMIINRKFFTNGFKGLINRSPNMDTLVALGSSAAFVYSTYALFAMTEAVRLGDHEGAKNYLHEFYFESAAMILTLITIGKMLETRSKGKTTDALKSLMDLAPKNASVIRNGSEMTIPVADVVKDDIFIVRAGESIPADGIVIEGSGAVDEAALTGESIPVDKVTGDNVSAATINRSGFLKCRAVNVGEDTALSQIIKMVSDAAASKAPIAKAADKVSGIFVPAVISISIITTAAWLISGETVGFALARGISVLVISCPCALGLATPVAIMVGSGIGAKNGILFKNAGALEAAGKISIAVLDKTGTITEGKPSVTDIIPSDDVSREELLKDAVSIEKLSSHPLAKAVAQIGNSENIEIAELSDLQTFTGNGLSAADGKEHIYAGNLSFISSKTKVMDDMNAKAEMLAAEGKTPLFFCRNDRLTGIIAVADKIKDESRRSIEELKNMGIRVVMLTGDNEKTAAAIGKQAGIDEIIAGILPNGKEKAIRKLKNEGIVTMVGDGINDAPALTRADVGIAIGAGTDVAIDAADIVLMKSRLSDLPAAIRLSRNVLKNIHQNLFWAFFYNIVGIPLAAGLWIPLWGLELDPMFGAAAMSLSSFCVVTNALRLNSVDIYNANKDKKIKPKKTKEKKTMTKTLKIEGMMCGHCEAAVKKALEGIEGVTSAEVSHETGTAVVTLSDDVLDDLLRKTVEDKDYTVISVE